MHIVNSYANPYKYHFLFHQLLYLIVLNKVKNNLHFMLDLKKINFILNKTFNF